MYFVDYIDGMEKYTQVTGWATFCLAKIFIIIEKKNYQQQLSMESFNVVL